MNDHQRRRIERLELSIERLQRGLDTNNHPQVQQELLLILERTREELQRIRDQQQRDQQIRQLEHFIDTQERRLRDPSRVDADRVATGLLLERARQELQRLHAPTPEDRSPGDPIDVPFLDGHGAAGSYSPEQYDLRQHVRQYARETNMHQLQEEFITEAAEMLNDTPSNQALNDSLPNHLAWSTVYENRILDQGSPTPPPPGSDLERSKMVQELANGRIERSALRRDNDDLAQRLKIALAAQKPKTKVVVKERIVDQEIYVHQLKPPIIMDLLKLCHPDKHGNSDLATRMTQWLLAEKKKTST